MTRPEEPLKTLVENTFEYFDLGVHAGDCKDESGEKGFCVSGAIKNYTNQLLTYGNTSSENQCKKPFQLFSALQLFSLQ